MFAKGASPGPPHFNPLRFCRPRTLAAQERHALIASTQEQKQCASI